MPTEQRCYAGATCQAASQHPDRTDSLTRVARAPADARRVAQIPDEEPPVAVQAGGPLPVRGEPDRRDVRPGRSGGASAAPVGQTLGATHRVKRRGLREGAQVLPGRTV